MPREKTVQERLQDLAKKVEARDRKPAKPRRRTPSATGVELDLRNTLQQALHVAYVEDRAEYEMASREVGMPVEMLVAASIAKVLVGMYAITPPEKGN